MLHEKLQHCPNPSRLIHDDSILLVAGQSNSDLAIYRVQSEGGEWNP